MIYNRSTHPVEVKKISVRLWKLRDEIEAAIERRIKECEAAGVPLFVDDIKQFYNLDLAAPLTEQDNVLQLHQKKDAADGINSLMETLGEEAAQEAQTPEAFSEAEKIIAQQSSEGAENKSPSPILQRPFKRQAPDLDRVTYGFTLLSDINMETVLAFTKDKFLQGQSVVVEFLIPQSFMVSADVTYCNYYAMRSRIISSTKPDYRVQCRFSFAFAGERDQLRSFLKSIEPEVARKKSRKAQEDDSLGV
jgi:hypothetical protein